MRYFFRAFNIPEDVADSFFEGLRAPDTDFVDYGAFVSVMGPFIQPSHHGSTPVSAKPKFGFRRVMNPNRQALAAGPDSPHFSSANAGPPRTERHHYGSDPNAELKTELRELFKDLGRKLAFKFKHMRDAFRMLDLERNGRITRQEMRSFFRGFGHDEILADRIYDLLVDPDTDAVDFGEFMQQFEVVLGPGFRCAQRAPLIQVSDPSLSKEVNDIAIMIKDRMTTKYKRVSDAFRSLDLDKSGKISLWEMSIFLRQFGLPPEMAAKFFRALDEDGSGEIPYNHFVNLFGDGENKNVKSQAPIMPRMC
mmetsp:Transcript_37627/g.99534  ORF Transcript_37627/g.99534 Transcript_37627/m.99534 type:complete len:308 (+) Transcript_37627:3-926(+)